MVDRPVGEDARFLKVTRRDAFPEDFRLATVAEAKKLLTKASAKGGGSSAELRPGRGEAFRLKDGYLFEFGTLKSFYPDLEDGGVKLAYKLGIRRSLYPDSADMTDLDAARALLHACYEDDEEQVRDIFNRNKGQDGVVGALRVKTPWYNGGNAFHLCCHLGKLNILSLLLHQLQQAEGGRCPPGQISPLLLPDNDEDTPFSHAAACKADNSELVIELLKHEECAKLSINQCNLMGFTPLMVAVNSGHANTCRELLSAQGIDVNSTDAEGNTILHLCALRSDPAGDILEVLWNDPRVLKLMSKQNMDGQTPLTQALKKGSSEFCLHVLKKDLDASILTAHANPHQDSSGYNILHFFALGGCERSVGDLLLEVLGSSTEQLINKADILGRSPFVLATVYDKFDAWAALWCLSDKEAIKQFLDDETGDNILHYYARSPNLVGSTGKELVDHMRELVNVSNDAGVTPIMYALRSGHTDACVLLLKVGDLQLDIDNKIYTNDQKNILHMYAKGGAGEAAGKELMRRLGDKNLKALITQQDSRGRTPLMIALSSGNALQAFYILQLCAEYGISVSLKEVDAKGNNIFHFWCMCDQANAELLEKLISFGTEAAVTNEFINAQNANGKTPLMCALKEGNTGLCRLLFEGKYVRAVHVLQNETLDPRGRNVFHYFALGSCEDAIVWEKLKKAYDPGKLPTVLNAQDKKNGSTPLMYALTGCSEACPLLFLREDSVVVNDLQDTEGETVLHWLTYASSIYNSEILLEFRRREWSKGLIHSTNKYNNTPLMNAARGGSLMLFEMLLEEVDSTDFLAKEDNKKHNLLHFMAAQSFSAKTCAFFQLLKVSKYAGENLVTSLLDKKNTDCRTPLMLAAYWKNAPACGWLLETLGDKTGEALQTHIDYKGRTALQLAVAVKIGAIQAPSNVIATLRVMLRKIPDRKQALKVIRDKRQQTVLHTAIASWGPSWASISNAPLLNFLLQECAELEEQEEENGYKPLFFAAMHQDLWAMHLLSKRNPRQLQERHIISKQTLLHAAASSGSVIAVRKVLEICEDLVRSVDAEGKTALHVACKAENMGGVRVLLKTSKELAQSKTSGRKTPLHEAARAGNLLAVKELLRDEVRGDGNTLLSERDADGRTALHFAAASISENEDEVLQVVQLLLKYEEDQKEADSKALLLYASAGHAVGTAHDIAKSSKVREYLSKEMDAVKATTPDLLQLAQKMKIVSMVKELINRGARLDHADPGYLQYLQVEKSKEADQPAMKDFLGKTKLAKGIAALLLNPFTAIPINIGIFGPWGMGKSSLMLQIEISLLLTIIKRNLVLSSQMQKGFPGLMKDVLSIKGKEIQEKFIHEINRNSKATTTTYQNASREYGTRFKGFLPQIMKVFSRLFGLWKGSNVPQTFEDIKDNQNLHGLLSSYNNDLHPLYKGLALADRTELVQVQSQKKEFRFELPSLLTIRYNAWLYEGEIEASAGLALTIMREMEAWMNTSQWLRHCWYYSYRKRKDFITINLIIPAIMVVVVGGWILWLVWRLLSIPNNEALNGFKYGSIPVSMFVITWAVLRNIMSVVKPASTQLLECTNLKKDEEQKLGYQQEVIDDINFFKNQLCEKSGLGWRILGKLWSIIVQNRDHIPGTNIPKMSISKSSLRIIAFIDDLDRCKSDGYILQLLSAVNLILSVCEINVVVGMDKKMVENAIKKEYKEDDDASDKFLQKIIQVPIQLYEPSVEEMKTFLRQQLGYSGKEQPNIDQIHHQPNASTTNQSDDATIVIVPTETTSSQNNTTANQNAMINVEDGLAVEFPVLIANYGDSEMEAFEKLQGEAKGDRNHPRNWKRLLNYHRLAWNIISQSQSDQHYVKNLEGWQQQLIVWVFVCYNWKPQMDVIIKNWDKMFITQKSSQGSETEEFLEDEREGSKTVSNGSNKSTMRDKEASKQANYPKRSKALHKSILSKHSPSLYAIVNVWFSQNNKEIPCDEKEEWEHLIRTLNDIYDVSMEGIQAFQNYRFHCMIGHLRWETGKVLKIETTISEEE